MMFFHSHTTCSTNNNKNIKPNKFRVYGGQKLQSAVKNHILPKNVLMLIWLSVKTFQKAHTILCTF